MIIKKLLNKIEINKYSFILIFLSLITGLFKEIFIIYLIIFFHELGHILISLFFKWNIKSITFYPFGGLTLYDEIIDKPLYQELLITLFGPIFQMMFFFIVYFLFKNNIIDEKIFIFFKNYNYSILLFNLLPILPLDGAKLLNIFINKFLNFRFSYNITTYISFLSLSVFIFYHFNYSYLILLTFLITEFIKILKEKKYMFNKFILEKSLYKNNYKKYKKVNSKKNMYRNKKNIIKNNGIYITEKQLYK